MAFDFQTVSELSLARVARSHFAVELCRPVPRNAERLPSLARIVLGQQDNLPDMHRVVRQLPVNRLHYRVCFSANRHRPCQIRVRQRLDCASKPRALQGDPQIRRHGCGWASLRP